MEYAYQQRSVLDPISTKKYENMEPHPVQQIQDNVVYKFLLEEELRMQGYSNGFGSHLPMKLTIERTVVAQHRRLPGLKSSNLGLEIAMNRLNKIDFEDFLNDVPLMKNREIPHLALIKDI